MRFSATIHPQHEELSWAIFKECQGNHNKLLGQLFNTALLAEALLRKQAADAATCPTPQADEEAP